MLKDLVPMSLTVDKWQKLISNEQDMVVFYLLLPQKVHLSDIEKAF